MKHFNDVLIVSIVTTYKIKILFIYPPYIPPYIAIELRWWRFSMTW